MTQLIDALRIDNQLPAVELKAIIQSGDYDQELFRQADQIRRQFYGTDVYIRGLIEITNHCKNNCFYCGIRRDNLEIERYRLDCDKILDCCRKGYELGMRTFVLQGGEDGFYSDQAICHLISRIKRMYGDCAVTLSLGERSYNSYKAFFDSGADRYLLRHETANDAHYAVLHPAHMSCDNRKRCLWDLKKIGYQVGSGFMVGSPHQTVELILEDLEFLKQLQPDMIGVGPFIPHKATPFSCFGSGKLDLCLRLLAILRLMFPKALIPATTALGTIAPNGREMGLMAGANVVMPNLSPIHVRGLYELYDNKLSSGCEAAENLKDLSERVRSAGYRLVTHIGHAKTHETLCLKHERGKTSE